ncbi:hypothetical protein A2U01_0074648, partial [Trifolium medium]|nr:hypothetical protein [Trifolium medium]
AALGAAPLAPGVIQESGIGGFVDSCAGRGLACAGRSAQGWGNHFITLETLID